MSRRLLALAIVLVLGLQLAPASAAGISYNANASLRAGVYYPDYGYNRGYSSYPTAQFSSTYTPYYPTPVQFPESPDTPGAPFLAPILNNWMYWGNVFNWLPSGNQSQYNYGNYNYGPYANYSYAPPAAMVPQATYYKPTSSQATPSATYTQPARTTMTPQASYTASATVDRTPVATYTPASTVMSTPTAHYTAPVAVDRTPVAVYTAPVKNTQTPVVTYTAPVNTTRTPIATYTAPANTTRTPVATYTNVGTARAATSGLAEHIPWLGTTRSNTQSSTTHLASLERNLPGTAYNQKGYTDGPAFGSLFGDGRDPHFSGSATEGFVTRLRSQTAPTYTYRAESLAEQDYGAFFGLEPRVAYTPVADYAYDGRFPTGNLNANPVRVTTPSDAVNQAVRDTSLAVPLQRHSTYQEDLMVMESRGLGLVVEQWKQQSPHRQLTRMNVMNLAIAMRLWRDTGRTPTVQNLNDATLNGWRKDAQGNIRPLPQVVDVPATDSRLATVVAAAYMRVMYMPELQVTGSQIQSFRADPEGIIERGQTLQALMTALYLRPDAAVLHAGYTDIPKDAWYAPWALTARTYGLNYGTRFEAGHKVSQEEAAYMVATLLRQLR